MSIVVTVTEIEVRDPALPDGTVTEVAPVPCFMTLPPEIHENSARLRSVLKLWAVTVTAVSGFGNRGETLRVTGSEIPGMPWALARENKEREKTKSKRELFIKWDIAILYHKVML